MTDIFAKFNSMVDTTELAKDVTDASNNKGGDYKEVPHGEYIVNVNKMEIKESKNGNPMLSIWFKVVEGNYKGSMIFFNQVITKGFQIHICNELLKALCDETVDIHFEDYKQYNDVVLDVFEKSDAFEYQLAYTKAKGDFSNYKIVEIFDKAQNDYA